MDLIVRRDTVFRSAGKPTIACKAGLAPQYAPDWVAQTHAYLLGVGCGNLAPVVDKTALVEQPTIVSTLSTFTAMAAETVDEPTDVQPTARKRGNGKQP